MDRIEEINSRLIEIRNREFAIYDLKEDGEALQARMERLVPVCSKVSSDWIDCMKAAHKRRVLADIEKAWNGYNGLREDYLKKGTYALVFNEYVKSKESYRQRKWVFDRDRDKLICVLDSLKLMQLFCESSGSSFIQEVGKALNCFRDLPKGYKAQEEFLSKPIQYPAKLNWDEAVKRAEIILGRGPDRLFEIERLEVMNKHLHRDLDSYSLLISEHNKLLEEDSRPQKDKLLSISCWWLLMGQFPDQIGIDLKNDIKRKIDPENQNSKCDFFCSKGGYILPDYSCILSSDIQKIEQPNGPLNQLKQELSSLENSLRDCLSTLRSNMQYLTTEWRNGQNLLSYIRANGVPSNCSLREGVKVISCSDVGSILSENRDLLESLLDTVRSEIGPIPDRKIFTRLYDTEGSMSQFNKDLNGYRDRLLKNMGNEFEEKYAHLDEESNKLYDEESELYSKWDDITKSDPAKYGFLRLELEQATKETIRAMFDDIVAKNATGRFSLPLINNPYMSCFSCPDYMVAMTELQPWQSTDGAGNLEFVYDRPEMKKWAIGSLNNTILSIILAFPVRKVNVTILDPMTTNDESFLTTRLDSRVCTLVNRDVDIRQLVDRWQARAATVSSYCENLVEYNERMKTILMPYEIVILIGTFSPALEAQLAPFIENGSRYGVYFFALSDANGERKGNFLQVPREEEYLELFDVTYSMPFHADDRVLDAAIEYINENARRDEEVKIITQDIPSLQAMEYGDPINDFAVPVGEVNGREIFFRLSSKHVHSFVIGQTGQGKSVFLHDVIAGAALRYSPELFQVYLLDFKLSGEELAHYKDVPHVRALLASGRDLSVTEAVIRDLRNQMQVRSDLLLEKGALSIEQYNAVAEKKMPRILVVVDECQELFRDNLHRLPGDSSTMNNIVSSIEQIASIGRAQGVHLLFATQTLAGAMIPPRVKALITDHYIFKCSADDAEQLVPGSGRKVQQFKVGNLLMCGEGGEAQFCAYLPDVDAMVDAAVRKASRINLDNPRFVFSGKSECSVSEREVQYLVENSGEDLRFLLGQSADVQRKDISRRLLEKRAENILLFGYNSAQVARAGYAALLTMMISNKAGKLGYTFYCINQLEPDDEEDAPVCRPLAALADAGLKIVSSNEEGEFLSAMAEKIRSREKQKCVIFILGQERFKAVRDEYEIPGQEAPAPAPGNIPIPFGKSQKRTYRSELRYILESGPEQGVHCILQVDRISNLLFEGSFTSRFVTGMFNYICMFRTEKEAEARLGVEGLYPQQLSDDDHNLRAWFIDDKKGKRVKFTPYNMIDENIINLYLG